MKEVLVKIAKVALVVATTIYAAMSAYMYVIQREQMYFPTADRVAPAQVGLANVREVVLSAESGLKFTSWYGQAVDDKPTVLFFHGNGGAVQHRAHVFRNFMSVGYGVFVLGYPGYGGNEGAPSEPAFQDASLLAYNYLRGAGLTADDVYLYGQSLGSGVAVQLAAKIEARGLILEAPMSSTVDIAKSHYPYLLIDLLMKDTYESSEYIKSIDMPLLVMHGSDDRVIPIGFGRKLFDAANDPKIFAEVDGAGHNNLQDYAIHELAKQFIETN